MLSLYKSLVRSKLEYCCPLWKCHKVTDIQVLEGVQKTFTSRIWGLQHLDYWQHLKALKLMSLQRRRECYLLIHMWKILNGCSPNDIDIKFCDQSRKGVRAKVHHFASPVLLEISHFMITHLQSKVLVSGIQCQLICTS